MKKLLLTTFVCSFIFYSGIAQTPKFGITAGTSIANYKQKFAGLSISADPKVGFTAGLLADLPLGNSFSIQPNINWVQKGTKSKYDGEKDITTINCFEIPVNLLYNTNGETGSFFIGGGPSFGFNLSGKNKYSDGTMSEDYKLSFGNNEVEDDMKQLDLGVNLITGYRLANGVFFSAGYNLGLNNMSLFSSDGESIKSNYFGFRIGYMLGGKN